MNLFEKDTRTALEAKEFMQFLAFAPIAFHAARALLNLGILAAIEKSSLRGLSESEAAEKVGISLYGSRVLLEAGLGIGLLVTNGERFLLTRAGHFLLRDDMTRINFNFVNDICYRGMMDLENAIRTGTPEGLKVFGEWETIYEALAHLPDSARQSWLTFDHFYSDGAFDAALPVVFKNHPRRLLDIGGNTGRWALRCVNFSADVEVCIADLPGQLKLAEAETRNRTGANRITRYPINLLDTDSVLPKNFDALWMSQFLDCFSENQIRVILGKCRDIMTPENRLYILEPFWDRQKFAAAAFSLQLTSLYFTTMANGNSQMYSSKFMVPLVRSLGFEIEKQFDFLGVAHSLLVCHPTGTPPGDI